MKRVQSAYLRTHFGKPTLPGLSLFALLLGCPDPQARFDEFTKRSDEIASHAGQAGQGGETGTGGSGGSESCAPTTAETLNGARYYASLSASLNPKKPIVFFADFEATESDDVTSFSMTLQPLLAADGETPVGDPVSGGPFEIAEDGTFAATLGNLVVEGSANPISGSQIVAEDVVFLGSACGAAELLCGTVTGHVAKPIQFELSTDKKQSTFAMQLLTGEEIPSEIIYSCNGDSIPTP